MLLKFLPLVFLILLNITEASKHLSPEPRRSLRESPLKVIAATTWTHVNAEESQSDTTVLNFYPLSDARIVFRIFGRELSHVGDHFDISSEDLPLQGHFVPSKTISYLGGHFSLAQGRSIISQEDIIPVVFGNNVVPLTTNGIAREGKKHATRDFVLQYQKDRTSRHGRYDYNAGYSVVVQTPKMYHVIPNLVVRLIKKEDLASYKPDYIKFTTLNPREDSAPFARKRDHVRTRLQKWNDQVMSWKWIQQLRNLFSRCTNYVCRRRINREIQQAEEMNESDTASLISDGSESTGSLSRSSSKSSFFSSGSGFESGRRMKKSPSYLKHYSDKAFGDADFDNYDEHVDESVTSLMASNNRVLERSQE